MRGMCREQRNCRGAIRSCHLINFIIQVQKNGMILLLIIANMGDLEDIIPKFQQNYAGMKGGIGNCNGFVRQNENGEVIVGHNTFNIYSLMLRVYKSYQFGLNDVSVKNNLTFSSRPGDLESKDDFVTLRESGMVVVESSLNNWNRSNYDWVVSESLPTWIRVNLASRLASNNEEWSRFFSFHRSGTHNNQWLSVELVSGRVLMVEEAFSLYKVSNMTESLREEGYVATFNVAYNSQIYDQNGNSHNQKHKYFLDYITGWKLNYTNDPRAKQFKKYAQTSQTVKDVGELVRINDNGTEYDICEQALSPRCDLVAGWNAFGGIDGKVVDLEWLENGLVYLISSPSYSSLPPFNWQSHQNEPHYGMVDQWAFPWFIYHDDSFTLSS